MWSKCTDFLFMVFSSILLTHTKATPQKWYQWKIQLQMVPTSQNLKAQNVCLAWNMRNWSLPLNTCYIVQWCTRISWPPGVPGYTADSIQSPVCSLYNKARQQLYSAHFTAHETTDFVLLTTSWEWSWKLLSSGTNWKWWFLNWLLWATKEHCKWKIHILSSKKELQSINMQIQNSSILFSVL